MSWIVRNTLNGTLELRGFLANNEPIRIAAGKLFDLDSISTDRQRIESSSQIEKAFAEGYIVTESKSENAVPQEEIVVSQQPEALTLWQQSMQKQVLAQSQNVDVLVAMMKTLIDRIDQSEKNKLDENRIIALMKNEIQTQIKLLTRNMSLNAPSGYGAEANGGGKEAHNRARLLEKTHKSMKVDFDPQRNTAVNTTVSQQNTNDMVDLLSGLDNL